VLLLITNVPPEHAQSIAESLVQEKRAACVTETPVTSTYRWEGAVQRDEEVTLTIKVSIHAAAGTRARLLELHPYDVPEILAIEVNKEHSHQPYVEWVREETEP
jgi:periplasmic divalent cation tolerance protein